MTKCACNWGRSGEQHEELHPEHFPTLYWSFSSPKTSSFRWAQSTSCYSSQPNLYTQEWKVYQSTFKDIQGITKGGKHWSGAKFSIPKISHQTQNSHWWNANNCKAKLNPHLEGFSIVKILSSLQNYSLVVSWFFQQDWLYSEQAKCTTPGCSMADKTY